MVFCGVRRMGRAGAKSFGYPTFWVNHFNQPLEELGIRPDGTSTNIDGLLDFVFNRTARP
jgi:2-haloacid dehalogenase